MTSWALCGLPRVLLPVLREGKFTPGQCEGNSRSPDSPHQVTLAVFPGSLWGGGSPHTSSNPSPSVESSQSTGGMGARGCVWTETAQPFARSPFRLLLSKSRTLQSFVQLQRGANSFICLWRRDHPGKWPWHDLSSLQCQLQSSRVGCSSDASVFHEKWFLSENPENSDFFPFT